MSEERAPIEGPHSHYCNICEGDWDHESVCREGPVACCPWCFPTTGAAPAPGARRGPHFHFCPECTQNWHHQAPCSAPLRAALPECTGCHGGDGGLPPDLAPARPHLSRRDFMRRARFVRKIIVPAAIAAGVIIAIPLLLLASSLWSRHARSVARILELPPIAIPPVSAPPVPAPLEEPPARAPEEQPSVAAQARQQREGERREARQTRAPEPRAARISPPSESPAAPKPAAPANPPGPADREEARVAPAPAPPSPAPAPPREAIAESAPRAPEATPPQSETRTANVPGPTVGSIPGALSQGGGAALDTLLPGPRQLV